MVNHLHTETIGQRHLRHRSAGRVPERRVIDYDTYGHLLDFIASAEERDGSLELSQVFTRAHLLNLFF